MAVERLYDDDDVGIRKLGGNFVGCHDQAIIAALTKERIQIPKTV